MLKWNISIQAILINRIGYQMVIDAEEQGLLKPGGTIIECTSGNTGMGLD